MRKILLSAALLTLAAGAAHAQNVHVNPSNGFISSAVKVPAGSDMLYVSGITPDVVVKAERLSRWMATLYARGVFFEWAVQFRAKYPEVPRDFRVTDAVREDFFTHLDGRPNAPDVTARTSWEAEKDKAVLDRALAEELVGAVHGPEAAYRLSIDGDVQLKKALTLFPEAEKLAGIGSAPEAIAKK